MVLISQEHMDKIMSSFVVDEKTGCWEWALGKNSDGYGQIRVGNKKVGVHRVMCPDLQDGMHALHKCDNSGCINPDHLFAGTPSDNMRDMWKKGRHSKPSDEFGHNLNRKLNRDDVIGVHLLYQLGVSQDAISKIAGCSQKNISKIINGVTWNNVYVLFN